MDVVVIHIEVEILLVSKKHCSYCDKHGHVISDCWTQQYDEEHGVTTKQPRLSNNSPCEYCGGNHPSFLFPPSKSFYRYFISFIDDWSRYPSAFLLRHKSEALSVFKQYKIAVEPHTSFWIKTLRSDYGGEYISNLFNDYCIECGIHREYTVPYSPQQNAHVERKNHTSLDDMRCMLLHSGLSRSFWAIALLTAIFVQNHLPTTAPSSQIPITTWTGETPSISHFRTFGRIARSS